ncbi:RNA polymerase sigma factor FliA [Cobetia marina]|uniref:RNA polymerase sigma factor FliA n=1 Tax=Cobetia marina TaxID=28258 RepID=A0ABU9GAD0_COBMA
MYTANGRMAQQDIYSEYQPLVRRIALQLQVRLPASVDLEDLIQAGMLGLCECVGRYEQGHGASFATYASRRIRGAMLDELRSRDWLPRSVRRAGRELESVIQQLEQSLGYPPEETQIASAMGLALEDYRRLLLDTNNGMVMSLDEMLDEDGAAPGGISTPYVEPFALPHEALEEADTRRALTEAIERLPEREKLLMALYYQENLNLKEIGAVLDVTESRVSQLHSQAVRRLQGVLAPHLVARAGKRRR